MKHLRTPLYQALKEHSDKNPVSLHVPGHKGGQIFPSIGKVDFEQVLKIDATEISGLDDLHSPEGVIRESESLLADLYGVKKSFFLVNGSTVGNLAMTMAVCSEGDIVLVQKNCHKSIMNALRLAKAQPVFIEPEYDEQWGVATGVSFSTMERALALHPNAKAVILTYPNYYGMVYELKQIIALIHHLGMPVLIDEAHGAHFIVGEPFPSSAVQLGADIVVQSAHKTLPAMTMGSYLHFNSETVSLSSLKDYLQVFQSSSPSYPIMASLDVARSYIGTFEAVDIEFLIEEVKRFRKELNEIEGIRVMDNENIRLDPLKVTIQSTLGLSGFELQGILEGGGVFAELADPLNVLFVLPLLKKGQTELLDEAIRKIKMISLNRMNKPGLEMKTYRLAKKELSELALSFKEMDRLATTEVEIVQATGKIAAETLIPYPPGIPLIMRGELLTTEAIEQLQFLLTLGTRFQGGELLESGKIRVFCSGKI